LIVDYSRPAAGVKRGGQLRLLAPITTSRRRAPVRDIVDSIAQNHSFADDRSWPAVSMGLSTVQSMASGRLLLIVDHWFRAFQVVHFDHGPH
jgi:hypothetical protein